MKKKTNPVWGGRFKKNSSPLLQKINNSINFDYRLVNEDIKLCKAYSSTLFNAKIISKSENKLIHDSLVKLSEELKKGKVNFSDE